ncbi:MAG: hypothetical protein D6705_02295 [Deltaproteobacteria bacterium]|nr:MAG: hypothetical protein D6705_02295 [Deltaproteobacteria bacterium]
MAPVDAPRFRALRTGPSALFAATVLAACGPRDGGSARQATSASAPATESDTKAPRVVIDLLAFGRVLGNIAPCGCTAEPLGGLEYAFGIVDGEDVSPDRIVVEPGSLLYPAPNQPEAPADDAAWRQAVARARALHRRFGQIGNRLVAGLGPYDRPVGKAAPEGPTFADLPLPRVLANAAAEEGAPAPFPHHRLVPISQHGRTIRVGVTEVLDPSLPDAKELVPLSDPAAALAKVVADMRREGAEITVAVIHAPPDRVTSIVEGVSGLDVAIAPIASGLESERLGAPPRRVGDTIVVYPGERLQTISHVRISLLPDAQLDGAKSWVLVPSEEDLVAERTRLERQIATYEKDPAADPAFIANLRRELEHVRAQLAGADPGGPVAVVVRQRKVTCHGNADPEAAKLLAAYDRTVAEENKKRFEGVRPPPPPKGKPGYAGIEECDLCHEEAVAFWRKTKHASAYATLENLGKQYDVACVGCHVTGFRKPGGSEVVENDGLRDVQCEVCHGPGSIHVEEPERNGKPHAIVREAPQEVCAACHTPEHSDTFDYTAYLRDVLGPGHGEEARKALGDGPTGAELRKAALAKAGGACKKTMMAPAGGSDAH